MLVCVRGWGSSDKHQCVEHSADDGCATTRSFLCTSIVKPLTKDQKSQTAALILMAATKLSDSSDVGGRSSVRR
jgi:hypothetical protein